MTEPSRLCLPWGMYCGCGNCGFGGCGNETRLFWYDGDMIGVGGFEGREDAADGGLSGTRTWTPPLALVLLLLLLVTLALAFELVLCFPPPESTVNGPFLPPEVRHGSLSIFPEALATGLAVCSRGAPAGLVGFGRMGRSLVGPVLTELVDVGEDLEEVVERGDGPAKGGEGVDCEMVADGVTGSVVNCERGQGREKEGRGKSQRGLRVTRGVEIKGWRRRKASSTRWHRSDRGGRMRNCCVCFGGDPTNHDHQERRDRQSKRRWRAEYARRIPKKEMTTMQGKERVGTGNAGRSNRSHADEKL